MYPKMQNQQKDDVSHTNLSFQEKPYDTLSRKKSMVKLSWNKFYPGDAPNHVMKLLQSPEATQEVKDGGRINFLIQGKNFLPLIYIIF